MNFQALLHTSSLAFRNRGNAGAGGNSRAEARLSRESRGLKTAATVADIKGIAPSVISAILSKPPIPSRRSGTCGVRELDRHDRPAGQDDPRVSLRASLQAGASHAWKVNTSFSTERDAYSSGVTVPNQGGEIIAWFADRIACAVRFVRRYCAVRKDCASVYSAISAALRTSRVVVVSGVKDQYLLPKCLAVLDFRVNREDPSDVRSAYERAFSQPVDLVLKRCSGDRNA